MNDKQNKEMNPEWIRLVRERYDPGDNVEMSYEDKNDLLWLLNAPKQYEVVPQMLEYATEHPEASMKELCHYFDEIVPPGLAPGDDGADLLDDDDDALLEGEDRGNTAVWIIGQMINTLQMYYDELKDEVDVTKDSFDHGLMTGYRNALEMLQDISYGIILPDPNKNNE